MKPLGSAPISRPRSPCRYSACVAVVLALLITLICFSQYSPKQLQVTAYDNHHDIFATMDLTIMPSFALSFNRDDFGITKKHHVIARIQPISPHAKNLIGDTNHIDCNGTLYKFASLDNRDSPRIVIDHHFAPDESWTIAFTHEKRNFWMAKTSALPTSRYSDKYSGNIVITHQ